MSGADYSARRTDPAAPVAAVREVKAETILFPDADGPVPNNPDLPVLLMRGAVEGDADAIMALYEANGWRRVWTYTVFDYQHYHPNAHEALTVASGKADVQLGGPSGPVLTVAAGDAMVLPAGTGHCRIGATDDFAVCGGYPPEQVDRVVVQAGTMALADAQAQIATLARPATDPIYGADGPTLRHWGEAAHGA